MKPTDDIPDFIKDMMGMKNEKLTDEQKVGEELMRLAKLYPSSNQTKND